MTNELTYVIKSATESRNTLGHAFISHFPHSLSQIGLVPVNYNYLLRTSTLETQWQSVLVVWAAFTTCVRHSLSSGKIAFIENANARGKRGLNLRNFCILLFSRSRLVSTSFSFKLVVINCAHRYPSSVSRCLLSQSREVILLFQFVKRRDTRYYIEDTRIAYRAIGCLLVEKSAYSKENDATSLSLFLISLRKATLLCGHCQR